MGGLATQRRSDAGPGSGGPIDPLGDALVDPLRPVASVAKTPPSSNPGTERQVLTGSRGDPPKGKTEPEPVKKTPDPVQVKHSVKTPQGEALAKKYGQNWESLERTGASERTFTTPDSNGGSANIIAGSDALALVNDGNSLGNEFTERFKKSGSAGTVDDVWADAAIHDINDGGSFAQGGVKRKTKGIKRAVVVGDSNYYRSTFEPHATVRPQKEALVNDLPGAARDATSVAGIYRGLGFDVRKYENLRASDLRSALSSAKSGLTAGDELFVYYSGHGTLGGFVAAEANYWAIEHGNTRKAEVPWTVATENAVAAMAGGWHATLVFDACQSGSYAPLMTEEQGADFKTQARHRVNLAEESVDDAKSSGTADGWMEARGSQYLGWDKETIKTLKGGT
jgi:hypothetical protein